SLWTRRLPRPSLFPYTTLFRSYRLGRRRFRAVAGHVDDEVVLDPVVHEPAQRCAAGEHFLAAFGADHAIVPGREVAPGGGAPGDALVVEPVDVAVDIAAHAGEAQVKLVGDQRDVGRGLEAEPVERAGGELDLSVGIVVRLAAEPLDRAADRVLARQRALRAAQDLDPVEVDEVERGTERDAVVDVVDVDADARFVRELEVVLADAADVDRGGLRAAALSARREADAGRALGELLDIGLVAGFHQRGVDRGDGERGFLQALPAELGGDDDFVDAAGFALGVLLLRVRRAPGQSRCESER